MGVDNSQERPTAVPAIQVHRWAIRANHSPRSSVNVYSVSASLTACYVEETHLADDKWTYEIATQRICPILSRTGP